MNKRLKNTVMAGLALLALVHGCTKIEEGYISDHMFYQVNPLVVQQGQTTYSAPLISNGSTNPLTVRLLKVKNAEGEDVTEQFTRPESIITYGGEVTSEDNTLEKLHAKLNDSLVTPFQVNSLGGRLEFTAATTYLPVGTFNIDLEVSNVKGTRILENACEIQLSKVETPYFIAYKRIQHTPGTQGFLFTSVEDEDITVNVEFIPGTPEGSFTNFRFLDKNGEAFNPAAGEVVRYRDNFPFFDTWNPYYPLVLEQDRFTQQLPNLGIKFPYFRQIRLGQNNWIDDSSRYDWRIPAGVLDEINTDLVGLISFQFYATGTYNITTQLHKFSKRHP